MRFIVMIIFVLVGIWMISANVSFVFFCVYVIFACSVIGAMYGLNRDSTYNASSYAAYQQWQDDFDEMVKKREEEEEEESRRKEREEEEESRREEREEEERRREKEFNEQWRMDYGEEPWDEQRLQEELKKWKQGNQ